MNEEIILDVIPIYKNEMYPTKEGVWHIRTDIRTESEREDTLNKMIMRIKREFSGCTAIIIIEKGIVIEVL